jgi:hypothetical protein
MDLTNEILLIGNGPSVLEHPYSSLIDLFGDVVRFNSFQIDFDDPLHKKCVGTKCTIVYGSELGKSYDNFVINYEKYKKNCIGFVKYILAQGNASEKTWIYDKDPARPMSNISCDVKMVNLSNLESQLSPEDDEIISWRESIQKYPMDIYIGFIRFPVNNWKGIKFNIIAPSAGLQAISHFYNLYDTIHIVGFDGKIDDEWWYYKENSITDIPVGLDYHNYEEEQRFINYSIKKKKIRLLSDVFNGSLYNDIYI